MSVFTDRDQFVESATKGSQIKFLIRSGDNPVHIIVTQTLCIVRHTGEGIELYIFRFLEILVKGYGTRRRSHPQTAVIVGSDKTSLVAGINRITFQMVTVIDKQNLSVLILREIIDTTGKGSRPDSPVMIFVHTIHIVIAQAIHIILLVKITGQLVRHSRRRGCLGTDQPVTFCRNPDHSFRILNDKIGCSLHGSADSGNYAVFRQISLISSIGVIYTKYTVLHTDPEIPLFVFTEGTYLIMQ